MYSVRTFRMMFSKGAFPVRSRRCSWIQSNAQA